MGLLRANPTWLLAKLIAHSLSSNIVTRVPWSQEFQHHIVYVCRQHHPHTVRLLIHQPENARVRLALLEIIPLETRDQQLVPGS